MPGVRWGHFDSIFSPAYWAVQAWLNVKGDYSNHRLGNTLTEEIAACLLGGYGIPAELGIAAFHKLKNSGIFQDEYEPKEDEILQLLSEPMQMNGKIRKYRFARQKAKYIAQSFHLLKNAPPSNISDMEFRKWLLSLPGIGPKTASWITRNWLDSDQVAIIDIHIFRVCVDIGLFHPNSCVEKNYFSLEDKFLQFASAVGIRASTLDAMMWRQVKDSGKYVPEFNREVHHIV